MSDPNETLCDGFESALLHQRFCLGDERLGERLADDSHDLEERNH